MRRHKYNAKRTVIDGITFASKHEAGRYCVLKMDEKGGYITGLSLQPRFKLQVLGQLICTYVADFQYRDTRTGRLVTEDAKGVRTDIYKLKKKLLKAIHGIEVKET
jgi:hypothetical protein